MEATFGQPTQAVKKALPLFLSKRLYCTCSKTSFLSEVQRAAASAQAKLRVLRSRVTLFRRPCERAAIDPSLPGPRVVRSAARRQSRRP